MLSIIIPYHNEGKEFILTTINSIKSTIDVNQYEIIVVDDCSSEKLTLDSIYEIYKKTTISNFNLENNKGFIYNNDKCILLDIGEDNYTLTYSIKNLDNSPTYFDMQCLDMWCNFKSTVKIINHDINKGVGQAFDTGVKEAKYDNIILMGSDIRFESNQWASKLINYVNQYPKSIICTTCVKYKEGQSFKDSIKYYGANLIKTLEKPKYKITTILEAEWINIPKEENIYDIQCILGACYIIKKDWYNYIDGWWGHKQWGTLEPYISLKCQKMGGRNLLAKDVETGHIFKKKDVNFHKLDFTNVIYNKLLVLELLFDGVEYDSLYKHIPNTALKRKSEDLLWQYKSDIEKKKVEYSQKFVVNNAPIKITNKTFIEEEADGIYTKYQHYRDSYKKSGYLKVWKSIVKHIANEHKVIDIGCGPGQFMELCIDRGIKNYVGYDISQVAIALANNIYNKKSSNTSIKLCKSNLLLEGNIEEGDVYVASEILEHIEEDWKIINLIPQGKQTIITVPNYLGGSHVRKFDTINDIKKRFTSIQFTNYEVVDMTGDRFIIIAKGIKYESSKTRRPKRGCK